MCVLCKFYGQHRFHSYQLLSNVAATYKTTLTKKLSEVEQIENVLSEVAMSQAETVLEIRNKAMEAQDKLEKQFAGKTIFNIIMNIHEHTQTTNRAQHILLLLISDAKQELVAALEQKEAVLLCMLDKQVEIREQILLEQRMEVAAARARALATKEEGNQQ